LGEKRREGEFGRTTQDNGVSNRPCKKEGANRNELRFAREEGEDARQDELGKKGAVEGLFGSGGVEITSHGKGRWHFGAHKVYESLGKS